MIELPDKQVRIGWEVFGQPVGARFCSPGRERDELVTNLLVNDEVTRVWYRDGAHPVVEIKDIRTVVRGPIDKPEKMYLVCNGCGEAFDEITTAHEHGASSPRDKTWCGDEGFVIQPESEAL